MFEVKLILFNKHVFKYFSDLGPKDVGNRQLETKGREIWQELQKVHGDGERRAALLRHVLLRSLWKVIYTQCMGTGK